MISSEIKYKVTGHVLIKDAKTGEVLLDRNNAVNNQNMAVAIARGLANNPTPSGGNTTNFQIYAIEFGNGGSVVSSTNDITFLPPNVNTPNARLYNATYWQCVDAQQSITPSTNSVTYQTTSGGGAIVIISATIAAGEPTGQDSTSSPPDPNLNSQFSFDELGLFTYGVGFQSVSPTGNPVATPTDSLLLTHIIFSPILKTADREMICTYTLSISVS